MKAVITCGGTGGHIMPALAIADILKANFPGVHVVFVGTEQGMERGMIADAGYPFVALNVIGLPRKISPSVLRAFYLAQQASRQAMRFLREERPHIVIGTGGYACYPTVRAAAKLHIPTALHESNAVPGLSVRMLSGCVDRIWLNFEGAEAYFKNKDHLLTVGNPLRRQFGAVERKRTLPKGCRRMVLSFGGSLGAERINAAVLEMMQNERWCSDVYHLHATGRREYEAFMQKFTAAGLHEARHLEVRPFISDMPLQMRAADVVISRAGAMSISELAMEGKAAVLIPSPNVTGNHQYINAKTLANEGAACLLTEAELTGERLFEVVKRLLEDEKERQGMMQKILKFSQPEAGKMIYRDVCYLLGGEK